MRMHDDKEDENSEIQRETDFFQFQTFCIKKTKQKKNRGTTRTILTNITVIYFLIKISVTLQGD